MSSEHTLNPTGGVLSRCVVEESSSNSTSRLRPGNLDETPCADPHAGCCGEGERETCLYPISQRVME